MRNRIAGLFAIGARLNPDRKIAQAFSKPITINIVKLDHKKP